MTSTSRAFLTAGHWVRWHRTRSPRSVQNTRRLLACFLLLSPGRSGNGSIGILRHTGEMDSDLAVSKDPTIGESHLLFPAGGSHGDRFHDHECLGVIGFRPEGDVRLQPLNAEDALLMLAQLLAAPVVERFLLETADEQGVVGVLVQQRLDVLLQDELDVLSVHSPQRRVGYVRHGSRLRLLKAGRVTRRKQVWVIRRGSYPHRAL